jgi:hypothetical protein
MSYAREDALHRQILNKEKTIKKQEITIKFLQKRIQELLDKRDERYNTLFMTYIKVCERNVDMQDIVTDLYNVNLTLKQLVEKRSV